MKQRAYRVIDANFNRVREGLRVCEEFVRFFSDDKILTGEFKKARSRISALYNKFGAGKNPLFMARDVSGDAGRRPFPVERKRARESDIFWASLNRSKEGLRVLEEFSKLTDKGLSDEFRRLRYKLYFLEQAAFKKLKNALKLR